MFDKKVKKKKKKYWYSLYRKLFVYNLVFIRFFKLFVLWDSIIFGINKIVSYLFINDFK